MTITINITRGDQAIAFADDAEFLEKWKSLACKTPHKTTFQQPDFVVQWGKIYRDTFELIIVNAYSNSGELVGLMPLALRMSNHILTHAGSQLAEYSGWLSLPWQNKSFLLAALKAIKTNITFSKWEWTYIAPGTDTSWFESDDFKDEHIYISHQTIESPLLDLHNEDKLRKVLKNKSVKSKINRLKRKGELRIERITQKKRALDLMDQVTDLVNFRHESAHNDAAFEEDQQQRSFYGSRCDDLENNHFSVLWMGEKLLAFHFGRLEKDCLHLGLSAFDPTESKHSPGVIFLIYLANLLKEENIRYIDLTPGGDQYKERFSNAHNTLHIAEFYFSKAQFKKILIRQSVKSAALNFLSLCNIDKHEIKDLFRKKETSATLNKHEISLYICHINKPDNKPSNPVDNVNIQKYSDLLSYTKNQIFKRQQLLEDATFRFSREETLFSIVCNSELSAYA